MDEELSIVVNLLKNSRFNKIERLVLTKALCQHSYKYFVGVYNIMIKLKNQLSIKQNLE